VKGGGGKGKGEKGKKKGMKSKSCFHCPFSCPEGKKKEGESVDFQMKRGRLPFSDRGERS